MPVVEINYHPLQASVNPITPAKNLLLHGALITIAVSPIPRPTLQQASMTPPATGLALIDTGATYTCIDETTCQALGIQAVGTATVNHVDGASIRACYPVQVSFPDLKLPPLKIIRATSVNLTNNTPPFIALIGRDVLSRFKLTYNGPRGRIEIAY